MKLESQMKFNMVEKIYKEEKMDAEAIVQKVDQQINLIEQELNMQ